MKIMKRIAAWGLMIFMTVLMLMFLIISAYGVYAFVKRGIGDYLLMRVMFALFDISKSKIGFLLDYAAVMVFVANIGFYIQSILSRVLRGDPVTKQQNIKNQ